MTEKNELTNNKQFNYDLVDSQTANELKLIEHSIAQIKSITWLALGEQFNLAQEKFSHNGGDRVSKDRDQSSNFELWLSDQGFKKRTAYNIINAYKEYKQLDTQSQEVFETLPQKIAYAVSAPSASNELKEAVYNGDITTTKEFKEFKASMDKQAGKLTEMIAYSEKEKANISAELGEVGDLYKTQKHQIEELKTKNEELQKNPKTIEVEKMPADYEKLKKEHDKAIGELKRVSEIAQDAQFDRDASESELSILRAELDAAGNSKEKIEDLNEQIKMKEEELKKANEIAQNILNIADFATNTNQLLETIGSTLFKIDFSNISYDDVSVVVLTSAANRLEDLVKTVKEKTAPLSQPKDQRHVIN